MRAILLLFVAIVAVGCGTTKWNDHPTHAAVTNAIAKIDDNA